jgi:hypothetical protein
MPAAKKATVKPPVEKFDTAEVLNGPIQLPPIDEVLTNQAANTWANITSATGNVTVSELVFSETAAKKPVKKTVKVPQKKTAEEIAAEEIAAYKATLAAKRLTPTTLARKDYPVTPVLPYGTRFYEAHGGIETFVVEQSPRKRVILTGGDGHPGFFADKRSSVFTMPFVEFVIQVAQGSSAVAASTLKVYFRTEPVRSLQDQLFIAPLPNLARNGTICAGSMPNARLATAAQSIEELIATFWGSIFRYGGQAVFPGFPKQRAGLFDAWGSHGDGADFAHWAEESKKNDSMWGLTVNWDKSEMTVEKAMNSRARGIGGQG